MYKDKTKRIVINVTPTLHRKVKRLAKNDNRSMASWLLIRLEEMLKEAS